MPDNVVIRGRDLRMGRGGPVDLGDVNVTVGGALSIAKEVGEPPGILGRLNAVRGQYQFQGRPFAIARGSGVRFRGAPWDPALDVDAERTISGVVATVHVGGTLERPEIALSSQPPLDQGDILSLIVFNQSMNSLPTEQRVSLAARAGAQAAGAIATPIADSVARALDLDQFDIRPMDRGGASVLLGRQVNDRLFVGFRYDFADADVGQVSFEYRLNEFLRIVTSLAQGGGRSRNVRRAEAAGFDLIFVVR
jgi:translocation and assembly module TamB